LLSPSQNSAFWASCQILLYIPFQFLIEIFTGAGKKNDDLFSVMFVDGVSDFIVDALMAYVESINTCEITAFGLTDIRVCLQS
jgi:hypothetical protein